MFDQNKEKKSHNYFISGCVCVPSKAYTNQRKQKRFFFKYSLKIK